MHEFYDDWDLFMGWVLKNKGIITPKLILVYNAMRASRMYAQTSYFWSGGSYPLSARWSLKYRSKAVVTHDRVLTNSVR